MISSTAARRAVLTILCVVLAPPLVRSQEAPPAAGPPRLAFVLSGGGARGAAHIGALKVLEELHVIPDLLVGTSMGSIVGALYAAGWSPDEIERLLSELDWGEIFSDTVDRPDKPFRRKLDDSRMYIQGKLHFRGLKPFVPAGVLGGQRLELLLDSLEMVSAAPEDFDRLPIPFRAVAVDVATGEAVVIDRGRLSRAMRASMAIPGMFPAVERDGRTLSDGGAVANLPIRIARELGAGAVIAIDITSPLVREGQEFEDFWSVFSRMNSMLTAFNRVEDVRAVKPGDVYVRPELGDIGFLDFDRATDAVGIGEAATRAQAEALRRFAASDEAWRAFRERRRPREREAVVVAAVKVENSSGLADGVVRANLPIDAGSVLDLGRLRESVMDLKSLDAFGTIGTRIEARPEGDTLVVTTPPPPYGRDSLQVGLYLEDDLQGHNTYSVYLRHLVQPINRLGGEVATTLEMGEPLRLASELYQPLDVEQRWYANPGAEASRQILPIWSDGEVLGRFQIKHWEARADLGRVLGRWGDLAVSLYRGNYDGSPESGFATVFPSFTETTGGTRVRFRVDTRERALLNRVGTRVEATYDHGSESLGAEASFRRWNLIAEHAFSWGENTVAPYLEAGENLDDAVGLASVFTLGGLGRLSGYGNYELLGERLALARVLYYRRVARFDISSLRLRAFLGVSAEAGNVFSFDEAVTTDKLILSGGPFVAAITPIGPIYLGYGMAEGGRDRVYITLGQHF
jgi:NTE family protein